LMMRGSDKQMILIRVDHMMTRNVDQMTN
jgi:hypothetical protein